MRPSLLFVCVALLCGCLGSRERPPRVVVRYYDGESLVIRWETTPEAIEQFLPEPLEPAERPVVTAAITRWPKVDYVADYMASPDGYSLGSLGISCLYEGQPGDYRLNLIENDDTPVFGGREFLGYPKKMGRVHIERKGKEVVVRLERKGIKIFQARATLEQDLPTLPPQSERRAPMTAEITEDSTWGWYGMRIKFSRKSGSSALDPSEKFDFGPALTRMAYTNDPGFSRPGVTVPCKIKELRFEPSPYDSPWSKLPIVKLIDVKYQAGNSSSMLSGEVVKGAHVDPAEFEPHSRYFYDY